MSFLAKLLTKINFLGIVAMHVAVPPVFTVKNTFGLSLKGENLQSFAFYQHNSSVYILIC